MIRARCGATPRVCCPRSCRVALATPEALSYAVRNLGYVCVTESNGSARVRIRPAIVSPIAFSALCYHLAETKPDRILVSWLEGSWQDKLFGSLQDAMRHMLDLLPSIDSGRAHDFKSRTRSIERIPTTNPLVSLFKLWLESRGPIQPERLERLIREGLQGRYVIVQTGQTKADVYLREVGRGFLLLRRPMAVAGRKACASRTSRTTSTASGWRRPIA